MKVFRTRACFEEEIATARLYLGDCLEVLASLDAESVSLVVTSPPYADQRADTYGGVAPDQYVDWFLPIARELHRVLKPDGTFILNIKEKVVDGERHTYVHELIAALRKIGWRWTEEFIWSKKNCFPGKWPTRFRDAWESCHQFNKSKSFRMFQDEVMVPIGDWSKTRLANLSETDLKRDESKVGSGFGKKIANWVGREMVYPTNVLDFPTECSNTGHSAAYPKELPTWFVKLFTQPGDWVLDPFLGSGTTCVAALELGRNSIGIEKMQEHYELAERNVSSAIAL